MKKHRLFIKQISESPIYLTRGGNVSNFAGSLRSAAGNGYYWLTVSYSEKYAYDLVFNDIDVYLSDTYQRLNGFTVGSSSFS